MIEKASNPDKMRLGEKLSFGVGEFGTSLIYSVIAVFLMVYYTDVALISASAAALIILIGRISDSVTDPVMGMIADRTRSRWGRFRPYLLFFSLPFAISAVLCFSVPDWEHNLKVIYAIITYVLVGIFYTTVDIPYWSMISAVTKDPQERSELSAIKRFANMFNNMLTAILFLPLVKLLGKGNQARGYQSVMIIFGIIGTAALIFTFAKIKERVHVKAKEKIKIKESLKTVFQNKPLIMVLITALFLGTTFNMRMAATIYYLTYNANNENLISAFLGLAVFSVLIGIIVSAKIAKVVGKRYACILGILGSSVCYLGLYFTGAENIPMMFFWNVLGAFCLGVPLVVYIGMIADTVDYAEWKTGTRSDSFIFAMNTLVYKLTAALGVTAVGFVLSYVGYIPNMPQTAKALQGINFSMTIVPFIGGIIAMIPMIFYKLEADKLKEINEELNGISK